MSKTSLPKTIRSFVEGQSSAALDEVWKSTQEDSLSPYGSFWCRAIACMMLSGRVAPKRHGDGAPNMTDVNRIGKEANFNQYLFERVATFLVAADVIAYPLEGPYGEGPNLNAFWDHDADRLAKMSRQAILYLVAEHTGYRPKRVAEIDKAHLIELIQLFFACFRGRALVESQVGEVLEAFARLPKDDLVEAARELDIPARVVDPEAWSGWLEPKRKKSLIEALYRADWAYCTERAKAVWFFASPTGLGMLGLEKPPRAPELPDTFKAGSDLSIFAGTGLAWQKLVPLFRHCTIKRVREVCEFRLDRKRLAQAPAGASAGEELRRALQELEPLPSAIVSLLGTESKLGGAVAIRWCSALVKPEDAAVLAAIREHPNLKGYIEPGAPPGYLLIKPQSDPNNFVWRCHALGFKVKQLRATGSDDPE